jgi:hypothetical protein
VGRTLVIHPGALGDVLLAVPALRALGRRDELVLASHPPVGELLVALGVVDETRRFDGLGLEKLFGHEAPARIQALSGVDVWRSPAIDVWRSPAIDRVVSWFGSRDPAFADRLKAQVPGAIVAPSIPSADAADQLVWRHLLSTVGNGVADADARCAPIQVSERLVDAGRRALVTSGWDGTRPLVMVHPGASGPAKRWSADGFAQVIAALAPHVGIVVHDGPLDGVAVREVLASLRGPLARLDNPALPTLAGALTHVDAYLGNDSGISHLAASVGVPSVVLFTSATTLRWRPWGPVVDTRVVSPELPINTADLQAITGLVMASLAGDRRGGP